MGEVQPVQGTIPSDENEVCLTGRMVTETVRTLNWEIELRMQRSWLQPWPWSLCSVLRQHNLLSKSLSPTINMQGYRKIVGEIFKSVQNGEKGER